MPDNMDNKIKVIGISRIRMQTDGEGITTLVGAYGCPLRCKYCLNPQSWTENANISEYGINELYQKLAIDDLYFQATGGGICFGGGEPLLYAKFIKEFSTLCKDKWKISIETSLNVPKENVRMLYGIADKWIVDIKDLKSEIYAEYTEKSNIPVIENLKLLIGNVSARKIRVRVPHIPSYNTDSDVKNSIAELKNMGITDIDEFNYVIKSPQKRIP